MVAEYGSVSAMSRTPAATTFGAGEYKGPVPQVNLRTPQIALVLRELRGAQLVVSGHMQRLVEGVEIELTKIVDTWTTEKRQ